MADQSRCFKLRLNDGRLKRFRISGSENQARYIKLKDIIAVRRDAAACARTSGDIATCTETSDQMQPLTPGQCCFSNQTLTKKPTQVPIWGRRMTWRSRRPRKKHRNIQI
ncbi:PREDICTED: uncharacterized protein LOC108685199 [Atta colombica]|uniref:uncharacterized protein LOC108685199 n=1 Tax=Atta colombica TaxID=520822 RepID=UPI00084C8222|nr:PREDICTED: uncharacterized protein LOC108685199 [Atta colombica]